VSGARNGLVPLDGDGIVYVLRYLRVSGKEQKDQGLSIPTQDAETTAYTLAHAAHGWLEDGRFEDVLKGTRDDRVGYQQALARMRELRRQGKRVVVVVFKTDRFGRRMIERMRCWEELQQLGVELHAVYEGGKQERQGHTIRAFLSEEEVMTLRDRVLGYRRFVQQRGWRTPGRAAWGYRWREASDDERARGAPKKVLVPDAAAAAYVAEAWRRRAGGDSIHAVAVWCAGLPAEARGGRTLDYAQTRAMFRAPVYVGRPDVGDVDVLARPGGNWQPLVDDATWAAVQARAAEHRRMPAQASGRYLLTGLVRCWRCTHRMDGRSFLPKASRLRGTGVRRRTYRCISRMRGAVGPAVACVAEAPADEIERRVLERVRPILTALAAPGVVALLAEYERREHAAAEAAGGSLRGRVGAETARLRRAQQALARAGTAKLLGEIGAIEYAAIRDVNVADIEAATRALAELKVGGERTAAPLPLAAILARVPDLARALERTEDTAAARSALGALVELVVPLPEGGKWGRRWRVEIEPTPLGRALFGAATALEACPVGGLANPNPPTRCSPGALAAG